MEEIKEEPIHPYNIGTKLSDFKILKELGKGSYGVVYTVKSNLDDIVYVMKKMELNNLKEKQQKECWREVSILKKVNHPYIIKYYSSFLENECLYIIMEYAENGDLYSLIKHYKRHMKVFEEIDIWRIADEILLGLDYLHDHKIIHRDIKCLNLFITKDKHIKIGDLGVSTIVSNMNAMHCTRVGTPLYLSPELVKQIPYDFKIDMWSFGCSLYHLACLEPPFTGDNIIVLGNNIVKGKQKPIPAQYSPELSKFIDTLLNKRPEKRPSAKEGFDYFPNEIKDKIKKIKINKEEGIKPRPFSSFGNKIITYNKEELESKDVKEIKRNEIENEQLEIDKEKDKQKEIMRQQKQREEEMKERERKKEIDQAIENKIEQEKEKEKLKIIEIEIDNNIVSNNSNYPEVKSLKYGNNSEIINQSSIQDKKDQAFSQFKKQKTDINISNSNSDNNNINQFKQSHKQTPIKTYKTVLSSQINNNNNNGIIINNENDNSFLKNTPSANTKVNKIIIPSSIGINPNAISILSNYNNEKSVKQINFEDKGFNIRKIKREEPIVINKHRNLLDQHSVKDIDRRKFHNDNNADQQFPCLLNDFKQTRNSSPFAFNNKQANPPPKNQRANSSRTRERPFTASSNRMFHTKSIPKSSRPFTAANWKRRQNNIINININVFNVDMNKRFLAPEINPLKHTFDEDMSMLKSISQSGQLNDMASNINLRELGFRKKDFVFDKIIKTLENGHQSKQLTINDLL